MPAVTSRYVVTVLLSALALAPWPAAPAGAGASRSAAPAAGAVACIDGLRSVRVQQSMRGLRVTYRRLTAGRVSVELLRGARRVATGVGGPRAATLRLGRILRRGRYRVRVTLTSAAGRDVHVATVIRRGRRFASGRAVRACTPTPGAPPRVSPAAPLAPPAATAATAADPTRPGPHAVEVIDYDAGLTVLTSGSTERPGATPQRLDGAIYLPSAPGRRPLVVLLHGKHQTCEAGGAIELLAAHPCPDTAATADIRSYRGYEYLARNLASHGYLVVSIGANGVNSYDYASRASGQLERAQLVAKTLDLLAEWDRAAGPDPVGERLIGRVGFDRIGLMGHSRGGEGVTAFIDYNRERSDGPRYPGLRAVLSLAATDFYDWKPRGVAYAALLPLCDGDVFDLSGARAYDRGRYADPAEPAHRAQYTVRGANHNYFNTVWVDGMWADDHAVRGQTDSACSADSPGSVRLTPAEQQAVGLALMAAFLRRHVGGEMAFDALARGASPLPAAACPRVLDCGGLVGVSSLAPAADRLVVLAPAGGADGLERTDSGGRLSARGLDGLSECTPSRDGTGCPTVPTRALARQLTLRWNGAGVLRAEVAAGGRDVSGFAALTLRAGVNYGDPLAQGAELDFEVVLEDAAGTRAAVPAAAYGNALRVPPGDHTRELTLNGIWIPLGAFAGVDLRRVVTVELVFGGRAAQGSVQLADLAFQR